jgi:hypothetical protein
MSDHSHHAGQRSALKGASPATTNHDRVPTEPTSQADHVTPAYVPADTPETVRAPLGHALDPHPELEESGPVDHAAMGHGDVDHAAMDHGGMAHDM